MGLFSKIGKSLGKIGDTISKAYKSVDKKAGGYLPGGVSPSQAKSSSPSSSSSSSKTSSSSSSSKSSGGSSSGSSYSFTASKPTYNPSTQTYTDSRGNKMSMSLSNALKSGASIVSSSSSKSSGGSSSLQQAPPKDPRTGKPYGTVTAYKRPKEGVLSEGLGLASLSSKIKGQRDILRTAKIRSRTGNIDTLRELELLGLAAAGTVVDFGKGIADLPETAYKIARNPKVLKQLPSAISQSGKEFGELLRVSPGEAFIKVGGEILLMKGTGAALNKMGSTSSKTLAKLNPKYTGEAKIGSTLKIKTGAGKTVNLKVVGKIPKEKLASQVSKAGKKLNAISSQADELLGFIKSRSKTIRKPIPGEAEFNAATKKLLKQFDAGTITKKNLLKLNEAIKKQGAKGLLERSFFADPTGKIRPSRLGVTDTKKGSLLDYLTEDITFKKAKPQILLFENVKVQSLPKALKTIGNKLKKGAALTKKEADALLKYQLKKSGKFKPIGFISGESEITLAPGEILKRVKKVGVTIANGKRIPIVKTEVFKPTGKIKTLLTKFNKGSLTKAQTKELDKLLKKATGFNYGLSSAKKIAGKYVDIKKIGAAALSKLTPKKQKVTSKTIPPKYVTTKKTTPPKPKKPTSPSKPKKKSGRSKATSKPTQKPKENSKPVSKKPKTKKPTSSLAASRRRKKKKALSSRKTPTSRRKSRYSGSSKRSSPRSPARSYSPKKPVSRKSPVSPRSYKSPTSKRKYKPYKSPTSKAGKGATSKTIKTTSKKKRKERKKPTVGYYVYEKRGKKGYKKLPGLPLTKNQAKDRLAYRLDNKISRTAKLVPVKKIKKLGSLPKSQKGYFNKYKKNLRNYKIVKGKRVKTPLTFIEKKGKGVISTQGEKRQLAINRRAKSSRKVKGYSKPVKRTVRRSPKKTTRPKTTKRTTRPTTKRTSVKRTTKRPSTSKRQNKARRRPRDPFRYW